MSSSVACLRLQRGTDVCLRLFNIFIIQLILNISTEILIFVALVAKE